MLLFLTGTRLLTVVLGVAVTNLTALFGGFGAVLALIDEARLGLEAETIRIAESAEVRLSFLPESGAVLEKDLVCLGVCLGDLALISGVACLLRIAGLSGEQIDFFLTISLSNLFSSCKVLIYS